MTEHALGIEVTRIHRFAHGSSSSIIARCNDGRRYVVKCPHNPQGHNVLANELIASRLMFAVGLRVPDWNIVRCSRSMCCHRFHDSSLTDAQNRLHFASSLLERRVLITPWDIIPPTIAEMIVNRRDLIGAMVFDIWAGAQDFRQLLYIPHHYRRSLEIVFVDNGHLFGGPDWDFRDSHGRAFVYNLGLYDELFDIDLCTDWICKLESVIPNILGQTLDAVPADWYDGDIQTLHHWLMRRIETLPKLFLQELPGLIRRSSQARNWRSTAVKA